MEKYYLGIDLGTSGAKLGLIDENLKIKFTKTVSYPLITKDFESEQNPGDWWSKISKALKDLDEEYKEGLVGLSFSGQMHGMVAIDSGGEVLRNAILWNDTRTFKEVKYLNEVIGKENLLNWTGNIALEGFTAPKVLWLKNNEQEVFSKINKVLLPKDWLAFKMTGKFVTDKSDAAGTLYYDVENSRWSKEMLDILGLKESQLPEVKNSNEEVGVLSKNLKEEFGFSNDVKVVIGGGDQAVNALSQGVVNEGSISISLGTSGVIFAPADTYSPSPQLHSFNSTTGKYCKMGVTLATGGSLQWFADNIVKNSSFEELTSEISLKKRDSILFLPYISGERTPINDPYSSGSFFGLRREHSDNDLVQAIIEGTAFSINQIYELIKKSGINPKNIYVSGGGSKQITWVKLIATLIDHDIKIFEEEFGPFYGAALLAYSHDTNTPLNEIQPDLKTSFVKPSTEDATFFKRKYELWESLFKNTIELSHKLLKATGI